MHTCGIIEDEDLAQQLLIKYINRYAGLEIAWSSETVVNPKSVAQVDIVFLDLLDNPSNALGLMSGGVKEFALHFPNIIITTAYPVEYVESVGIRHTQVLTKPYTYLAFERAVTAALRRCKIA